MDNFAEKKEKLERQLQSLEFNKEGIEFMIRVHESGVIGGSSSRQGEGENKSKSIQEKCTRLEKVKNEIEQVKKEIEQLKG
nr:hypothetical protein Iba_chr07dCG12170 [Ipomoea batatas]